MAKRRTSALKDVLLEGEVIEREPNPEGLAREKKSREAIVGLKARAPQRERWVDRAVVEMREERSQGVVGRLLVEEYGVTEAEAWWAIARARERLGWTSEKKKEALVESAIERAEERRARAITIVEENSADRVSALSQVGQADDQLNRLSGAYEPEKLDVQESVFEVGAEEALQKLAQEMKRLGVGGDPDVGGGE